MQNFDIIFAIAMAFAAILPMLGIGPPAPLKSCNAYFLTINLETALILKLVSSHGQGTTFKKNVFESCNADFLPMIPSVQGTKIFFLPPFRRLTLISIGHLVGLITGIPLESFRFTHSLLEY